MFSSAFPSAVPSVVPSAFPFGFSFSCSVFFFLGCDLSFSTFGQSLNFYLELYVPLPTYFWNAKKISDSFEEVFATLNFFLEKVKSEEKGYYSVHLIKNLFSSLSSTQVLLSSSLLRRTPFATFYLVLRCTPLSSFTPLLYRTPFLARLAPHLHHSSLHAFLASSHSPFLHRTLFSLNSPSPLTQVFTTSQKLIFFRSFEWWKFRLSSSIGSPPKSALKTLKML